MRYVLQGTLYKLRSTSCFLRLLSLYASLSASVNISQLVFWLAVVWTVNFPLCSLHTTGFQNSKYYSIYCTCLILMISDWDGKHKISRTHLTPQENQAKESLEASDNQAFVDFVQEEGIWPKIRVMCSFHYSPTMLNPWDPKAGCLSNILLTVFCLKLHSFNPDCFSKWCTRT